MLLEFFNNTDTISNPQYNDSKKKKKDLRSKTADHHFELVSKLSNQGQIKMKMKSKASFTTFQEDKKV